MNQRIFYCKEWSVGYKEPINIWDEQKALKKHKAGEPYTVLIGSDSVILPFLTEAISRIRSCVEYAALA